MLGARDTEPTTEEPILIYDEAGCPCERRPLHGTIKAAMQAPFPKRACQPAALGISAAGTATRRIASPKPQSTTTDGSPRFDNANQSHGP